MRVRATLITLALFCFAILGCFEVEQSLELNKDMSGTADLHLGIDFEPMVLISATMQKQMEGKEGPPSEEELAKARAEFRSKQEMDTTEEMPSLEEANQDLPEGIRLVDMSVDEGDLRMVSKFRFAFDTLSNLVNLRLPSSGGDEAAEQGGIFDSPFQNIELIDGGDTFTIRTQPENPAENVEKQVEEQGAPPDAEMEKMMEDAFKNLRFTWKIKAPFEVVSHNASRVEGDTLVWVYDIQRFKEMTASGVAEDLAIHVTYRR